MIQVSKETAQQLQKVLPDVFIVTTARQKTKGKRKKHYVEESPAVLRALVKLRADETEPAAFATQPRR